MPSGFDQGPVFKSGLKKPTSGPMFNKDFTPHKKMSNYESVIGSISISQGGESPDPIKTQLALGDPEEPVRIRSMTVIDTHNQIVVEETHSFEQIESLRKDAAHSYKKSECISNQKLEDIDQKEFEEILSKSQIEHIPDREEEPEIDVELLNDEEDDLLKSL